MGLQKKKEKMRKWGKMDLASSEVLGPIFSNFLRFWYQKKAHFFLISHEKFYNSNVSCLEDIGENVTMIKNTVR